MGIHKAKKLIKASLYAAVIACAAGAATGTYAWYSYQKDVAVDMAGTTIKADKEIQVGLRSDVLLPGLEGEYRLGEIEDPETVSYTDGGSSFYIYWIRGNYLTEILRTFHREINSAQGTLRAITAGAYTAGAQEDIGNENPAAGVWNGFKKTPSSKEEERKYGGLVGEDKRDLFYLPLAFRALSNEKDGEGNPVYLEDVEIFLSDFQSVDKSVVPGSGLDLSDSLRVKVDYPSHATTAQNYIFNPKAADDNNLKVAGPLNLNFDPYYDYDDYSKEEIAYGEWTNTVTYESEPTSTPGTLDVTECTTFLANHKVGVKQISSSSQEATCQTFSKNKAINSAKTEGAGKNIAITDCDKNYGYVDLSIYLEGWDENIVNSVAGNRVLSTDGHAFSIQLEFSIN